MMELRQTTITGFQQKILGRYAEHKRALPWRDCYDPYKVLVSEVMLQQTQVDRVIPKFLAFINDLPDYHALVVTDRHTLLRLWSGLGFNSRAIRLQQAAKMVLERFDGLLPDSRDGLQELPGIGPYCSASILAFAFNIPAPVVDTNIRRVLITELGLDENITVKQLESVALQIVPEGRSNDRHNALMDYGSLVATASQTGIKPISKQSKFQGSVREARGMIIRYLLEHKSVRKTVLDKAIIHTEYDKALESLTGEGFIVVNNEELSLE